MPADIRPSGTLGPFTWCGLTVYVAAAGSQHEAPEITDYRQSYLNQRLQELILTLDITLGNPEHPVEVLAPADEKLSFFERVFKDVTIPHRQFTARELSAHNTKDDLYVAIDGKVLDVTGKSTAYTCIASSRLANANILYVQNGRIDILEAQISYSTTAAKTQQMSLESGTRQTSSKHMPPGQSLERLHPSP